MFALQGSASREVSVRSEGRLAGAAGAGRALTGAGAAERERAGACRTGPGVPLGAGVQALGNQGWSPVRGHCLRCGLGVCQCKEEENRETSSLNLRFWGERSGLGRIVPVCLHPSGGRVGVRDVIEVC